MSAIAQELDEKVMDLVRGAVRPMCEDEIMAASVAVDIIREINERGYIIVRAR